MGHTGVRAHRDVDVTRVTQVVVLVERIDTDYKVDMYS